ncbi:MAG: 3',5'-cyclic-nucleotide phosphodiesterase [Oligoflexia bacterium]|nr:3',5'-cyclic-nucleotide phosphodiesterase [Oligoflexia bacterium]
MRLKVLGGDGGVAPGFQTTSFLINQSILVDAGSAATSLSLSEQKKIDTIFISHSHLDHIKDIAFLADNVFAIRKTPIQLVSTPEILQILKDHLFNNKIWPDFSVISNGTCPILAYQPIEHSMTLGGITFEIYPVHHPVPAIGFIIRGKKSSIVISGDTGPTTLLWQKANQEKNLKAIFTEIAFPNKMTKVAEAAGHFTPQMFKAELSKIENNPALYIYHLKPEYKALLLKEIKALKIPKLKLIKLKQRYTF